jgi:hypothetical protein
MPPKKKSVEKKSKPLIEEPTPSSFYDIITSKEFINFNKDFAKNLIAAFIYKTVYDAASPRPVIAPQPDPEPIRRGLVVPARRGIVVEGREIQPPHDNDGFTEIVFRDRPAEYPAEFGEHDFGVTPESISVPFNNIFEPGELELEQAAAAAIMARIEESNKKLNGRGFTDGNTLQHVGKEAFKALLFAGLAGAVGTYAIKSAENERNLNYDAENTTPYIIPPRNIPYNLEERAKNWTAEVKNKNQMHNILSEFDDISSDISGISHFSSGSYGLGLKKTKKLRKKGSDSEQHQDLQKPQSFSQVSKRINDKIREGIKYIYDHSPDKKTIMTFIAVIFALGTALIFANSQSLTEEAINHIMNFSNILSDCANGRVTLNGVKAYVDHYLNLNFYRGGKLKKSSKEKKLEEISIPETFYDKRIKPIAKKAYNIITSNETITVAKSLAQIAFLTLVMYGIKEAGSAMYGSLTPSPERLRPARQDLTELAESEIMRPTFYTEASGRHRGEIVEYNKSQYPREWPKDVGEHSKYSENYNPPNISKINRILAEADEKIYTSKPKTEELIAALKKEDPIHIKNLMLKHPVLRDIKARNPHRFTEEFKEHLPTLKEKINWKKGQMLSGKGLTEGNTLQYSKIKLKKIAKKIYDTMKSEHNQDAIKGITVATVLAGLIALLHSRQHAAEAIPLQLSPEELKEQYMNRMGEDVLFQ